MTSRRREPSAPPLLRGFEFSRILGRGGFADVFLYTQQLPRRSVAVKVLLASALSDDLLYRFRTEADVMARLSHHPSIVTIYHADVAPDGRPYLVMEYCAQAGLGQRYRTERMSVAEVLRIGVRLACAVETAHQAGILHRDIKPANVLVTDFGWPALTDFGIAETTGLSSGAAVGMSIPWSPPELLAENPTGDVRADVYSLAATIYSLLAGRSPFEVPGGRNNAADLIGRIEGATLTSTGRSDVPESLQAVLARAMDRVPVRRHHSALALARALQQVEVELLLPPTPLDLLAAVGLPTAGASAGPESDQATRLHPILSVSGADGPPDAKPATANPPAARSGPDPDLPGRLSSAHRRTRQRGRADRRGRTAAGVVGGLVVAGALIGVVLGVQGAADRATAAAAGMTPAGATRPGGTGSPSGTPQAAVPTPTDLIGRWADDGRAVFTWANPDPRTGDRYLWGVAVAGSETVLAVVDEATVSIAPEIAGPSVCVEVAIVRADRRASTVSAVGCTS